MITHRYKIKIRKAYWIFRKRVFNFSLNTLSLYHFYIVGPFPLFLQMQLFDKGQKTETLRF